MRTPTAIFLSVITIGYCMPCSVAYARYHRNVNSITVLNVFLGWTFLGWVVALVWAFSDDVDPPDDSDDDGPWVPTLGAKDTTSRQSAWTDRVNPFEQEERIRKWKEEREQ